MNRSRSIGINLREMLGIEDKCFQLLKHCRTVTKGAFCIIFYHDDIPETEIKQFVNKNSEILFDLVTQITSNRDEYVFFLINSDASINDNYRYLFRGPVLRGLTEYLDLIKHINSRDKR
jgi:hypothetical protein